MEFTTSVTIFEGGAIPGKAFTQETNLSLIMHCCGTLEHFLVYIYILND